MGVITETNAEKAIEELKAYEADVATALRQVGGGAVAVRSALGPLATCIRPRVDKLLLLLLLLQQSVPMDCIQSREARA